MSSSSSFLSASPNRATSNAATSGEALSNDATTGGRSASPRVDAPITGWHDAAAAGHLPVDAAKLAKRLRRQVSQAMADFQMIEAGDKVMVCLSGGKDSHVLLDVLLHLRERGSTPFEIVAVNLDQKQPGFPADVLPAYLQSRGVDFHIAEQDTYSVVKRLVPEGGTMCSLCSRMRRGALYKLATQLGATRIALGHHRDDILQTFFLNMFFGARLKAMPAKLVSDDGRHVVIRPLAYVAEDDLARWSRLQNFPIIPCLLCGNQPNLQRVRIGAMLKAWERETPGRLANIFRSLSAVSTSHLLDRNLFAFETLQPDGLAHGDGDHAFDDAAAQGADDCAPSGSRLTPLMRLAIQTRDSRSEPEQAEGFAAGS